MCGIAGGVALASALLVEPERVERMSGLVAHRGPDAHGLWRDPRGRVCLAHRRLSIIDLSDGARQPMRSADGRFTLVFNGEIYNYRELRDRLRTEGAAFATESDTEVLLRLVEREGMACLARLRGMFAFAVWDAAREELTLARDRLGKKPLYYAVEDGCLYFASTFAALQRTSRAARAVDPVAVDSYLNLGYIPAPYTITPGISKLPAGTLLTAGASGVRSERYWEIAREIEPFEGSYEQALDRLDELVQTATALRLRSDVPLGIFLSGGIDSSLVAAIAARQSSAPVRTFSISFEESSHDESEYARAVADRIGAEHRTFRVRPDIVELLPAVLPHLGEPFADATVLPTWLLARETRAHVTVALGGDGGDEAFGGYAWYRTAARLERLRGVLGAPLAAAGQKVAALGRGASARAARLERGASLLRLDEADRFAALRSFIGPREASQLYAGELAAARRQGDAERRDRLAERFQQYAGSSLQRMRVVDLTTYLADCLLPKVDVPTMAFGLEARAPLLDHEVVRFAMGLPDGWLVRGREDKSILRTLLYRYLPAALFDRPKQGFTVPLEHWFTTALREPVRALARRGPLLDTGWFRREGIQQMIDEHTAGRRDHSQRLYSLLVLDEWLRTSGAV